MINKLQYLGEITHPNMIIESPFNAAKELLFNQVYYRMIKLDNNIAHQWFVSQNKELLENGYVSTDKEYLGIVNFLNEVVPGWTSVQE